MDVKSVIGLIAIVISIIGYVPYFRDIFSGKTKPHAFSWLVWGVLNGIAFIGQLHARGGPGAWAVGVTATALCTIFALALVRGERDIRRFDWLYLGGAAAALCLWGLTEKPVLAIILITIVDLFGFLPTVRKAYAKPHQETLSTYQINTLKYLLVVIALQHYTLTTTLFPAAVALMNGAFVAMLVVRRQKLQV